MRRSVSDVDVPRAHGEHLRIAVIAHSGSRIGGVETYLADVVPALASRHEVACWFENPPQAGLPVVCPSAMVRGRSHDDVAGIPAAVEAWGPDVIYLHGLRDAAVERRLLDVAPIVFFAHEYYGACISGQKATRLPVHTACDRTLGAGCLARYLPQRCGGLSPLTMVREYSLQRRRRELLSAYAAVLVASRHMAREYEACGVAARVVPLPAAPIASVDARPQPRPTTVLYLGRLEAAKGVADGLRACAHAAGVLGAPLRTIVAGHGSMAAALAHLAATLEFPLFTTEFRPWLEDAGKAAACAEADLLMVPSIWPEPFGLVGLEAASAGLPAVAFRSGGIEDWLVDGVTGQLVSPGGDRIRAFGEAVASMLRDPDRLRQMGREAARISRRFSMLSHLQHLEPILAAAGSGLRKPVPEREAMAR